MAEGLFRQTVDGGGRFDRAERAGIMRLVRGATTAHVHVRRPHATGRCQGILILDIGIALTGVNVADDQSTAPIVLESATPSASAESQNTSPSLSSVVEPEEFEVRELGFEDLAPGADLAENAAAGVQMVGRRGEDAADDVEPVEAGAERHGGLVPIFLRQFLHGDLVDIGRVGEDQVVALAFERREQIALIELDPAGEPLLVDIDARDLERVGREVDRIDLGILEHVGGENRDGAGPGAEVQHRLDRIRILDQREILAAEGIGIEQLADEGARDDHALVDIERDALHIGALQEDRRAACAW